MYPGTKYQPQTIKTMAKFCIFMVFWFISFEAQLVLNFLVIPRFQPAKFLKKFLGFCHSEPRFSYKWFLIQYQPSRTGGTRSPPATPHRLQCRTACKIQNGCLGAPKWPMGSGKVSNIKFLCVHVNFCWKSLLIRALLLWEKVATGRPQHIFIQGIPALWRRLHSLTACNAAPFATPAKSKMANRVWNGVYP